MKYLLPTCPVRKWTCIMKYVIIMTDQSNNSATSLDEQYMLITSLPNTIIVLFIILSETSPSYTSGHIRTSVVQKQAKWVIIIFPAHIYVKHTLTDDLWFQQLPGQASHTPGTENLHHWWILRSCSYSWIVECHSSSCCSLCCFQDPSCTPP